MLRTASAPTYNLLRDCIAARSAFKAEKQEYEEEEYDIKTSEKSIMIIMTRLQSFTAAHPVYEATQVTYMYHVLAV